MANLECFNLDFCALFDILKQRGRDVNLYENAATQAIASFFHHEPRWKKEILFGFLLKPFGMTLDNIKDVVTQNHLPGTIPDFTIQTTDNQKIHFEVKISDANLTESEIVPGTRDAFLVRKRYRFLEDIPVAKDNILFWEDLFAIIDKHGAANDFSRLALVREYMHDEEHTLLLTPHEVAMMYSPDTVAAVYTMSQKIMRLCENFLDSPSASAAYAADKPQQDDLGIGYYFHEKHGKPRNFFVGFSASVPSPYCFSIALQLNDNAPTPGKNWYTDDEWAYFPLDREILAKDISETELQASFNANVEEVLKSIQ